ncbi:RDD family protein [Streptomyces sp. NA02950]|uniref:RDD family protein n=1 Tax=Streptomyces sp. NA02950 TaxID=2742137 RepID=UPI001591C4D0|nr:RDD family protein [Streptomyces sp. NA02950]QKV94531.1 RDD family protein [Streptomyces sp. NA02950]
MIAQRGQQPPYGPMPSSPHLSPHPPPGPHPPPAPRLPEPAGDERRMLAATVDFLLAFGVGTPLALRVLPQLKVEANALVLFLVCVFGLSFANQILGAWVFRASAGKWLLRMRVVREPDAGRPGFWRLVHRWLLGMTWLPMQPVRGLFCADGDPYEDHCKVVYVRVKDLRRLGYPG